MSHSSENIDKQEVSSIDEYETESGDNEEGTTNSNPFLAEKQIGFKKTYILHLSATTEANCNIAVGTSDNVCGIYRLGENQLAQLETFPHLDTCINGVQFSPDSNDLVYCGSTNKIQLWDLRTPQEHVLEFAEDTADPKPLSCFEVSPNNRVLCAGTELYKGDAFMLFWDVRNASLMGGYWESHSDNVTQIRFHPTDVNKLMTGSLDGLINIFDIKHTKEDDALLDSFNTESFVEQLLWFSTKGKDCFSCITPTDEIQLWSTDGTEPYAHFRKPNISDAMNRISDVLYVVSNHKTLADDLVVLIGESDRRRLKYFHAKKKELIPAETFTGCPQRVRCSVYNQYHNILLTGGEKGLLHVWNANFKL